MLKYYSWTPSRCACCECNKKYGIDEYLKDYTCLKGFIKFSNYIACYEIVNTWGTVSINSADKKVTCKMDYFFLSTILWVIMCLLFLIVLLLYVATVFSNNQKKKPF